jgi:hypothetical protein
MPGEKLTEKWSSRKFVAVMFWQAIMVALLWNDKLPPEAFVSITWVLLGAYVAGNVAQHIWEPKK